MVPDSHIWSETVTETNAFSVDFPIILCYYVWMWQIMLHRVKATLTLWATILTLCLVYVSLIPFSWEMFNWHYLCHSDSETAAASFCLHILLKGRLHWLFTALSLLEGGWWPGPPRMERLRGPWIFLETFRFTFQHLLKSSTYLSH